jgi:hypothetical protein
VRFASRCANYSLYVPWGFGRGRVGWTNVHNTLTGILGGFYCAFEITKAARATDQGQSMGLHQDCASYSLYVPCQALVETAVSRLTT